MTLNEITYSILGQVKPVLTNDSNLTTLQVKNDIIAERADLIKRHLDSGRVIDDVFIQDLGCVELEIADAADCCNVDSGCTFVRTKVTLPQEIQYTRVGPINKGQKRFTFIPFESVDYVGNGRFNKDTVYAFALNDRIYLKSNNSNIANLEYINIRGVFENPRLVEGFNKCDTNDICYNDDMNFPMPKWMEVHIREKLIKSYLRSEQLPKDLGNDNKDQKTDAS
jgi:hypothetical protein